VQESRYYPLIVVAALFVLVALGAEFGTVESYLIRW
jgi:hypothetical protein